jgi:hypothetical protein
MYSKIRSLAHRFLPVLGFCASFIASSVVVSMAAGTSGAPATGTFFVEATPTITTSSGTFVSGIVNVLGFASSDFDTAGVQFQINGQNLGNEVTTGACGTGWDTTGTPDGPYAVSAVARDSLGNVITAPPVTVNVVNSSFQVTNVTVSNVTMTSVTINWSTNQNADSQVLYGLSSAYGASAQDVTLVMTHSLTLSGLTAGTQYHYQAQSHDLLGNAAVSSDLLFSTANNPMTWPIVTWLSPSSILYGTALDANELNASANVPGTFAYSPTFGATPDAGTQTLSVVFTPVDNAHFATVSASVPLTVLAAPAVVNWATPSAVADGTALGPSQLDAAANTAGSFAYSPAAGTVVRTGAVPLSVTFTPTSPNYSAVTAGVTLTVMPLQINGVATSGVTTNSATITWATSQPSTSRVVYGPTAQYGLSTALNSSLVVWHSQTLTGLSANTAYHFQVLSQTALGSAGSSTDLVFVTSGGSGNMPTLTWPAPSPITYGTALGAAQLDASANVPGTFSYSPAAGTVLLANPTQTLTVIFRPTDAIHYMSASAMVSLNVQKGTPTVTWPTPGPLTDGAVLSRVQLNATANMPGTFTYSPALNTIVHTGLVPLTVTFTPLDIDYAPVTSSVNLTVGGQFLVPSAPVSCSTRVPRPGVSPVTASCDMRSFTDETGTWNIVTAASGFNTTTSYQWGLPGDVPLHADFDGDGKPDLVVYRPGNGTWYVRLSSSNFGYANWTSYQWGLPGDIPVPADFDGDGKTDLAVFRPADGTWYVRFSSSNYSYDNWTSYQWGLPGDLPLVADFDGDGKADLTVYRPSNGTWFVRLSSSNYSYSNWIAYQWGLPGDVPIAEDFDGDGKTDLAVFRPTEGNWYVRFSRSNYSYANWTTYQWGMPGDKPITGDFDGDGKADLVVWRPSVGHWYIRFSSNSYSYNSWREIKQN